MEGIQTIQALKAVQSSLPAQTTIPSDELVMLYAADGTPIAKIARDDLVKAVASVMASNSQNTFSKLLGVQANGTPMGIGASDLASVLGVAGLFNGHKFSSTYKGNLNDIRANCCCRFDANCTNNPLPNLGQYSQAGFIICFYYSTGGTESTYQIVGNYDLSVGDLYIRGGREGGFWSSWKKITLTAV